MKAENRRRIAPSLPASDPCPQPSNGAGASNFVTVNAVYHRAYLPNGADGTLTIINTDTDTVDKTVTVGTDVQVRGHVREKYGVMISGGQGAGNLVRIGHMGPTARGLHPVVGVAALGRSLADLGAQVQIGDGVEAALEVLAGAAAPVT